MSERRWGELYRESEKAKGAQGNPNGQGAKVVRSSDSTTQTLSEMNVSYDQSSDWQKLADIPEKEFEDLLENHVKPSSNKTIIKAARLWFLWNSHPLTISRG